VTSWIWRSQVKHSTDLLICVTYLYVYHWNHCYSIPSSSLQLLLHNIYLIALFRWEELNINPSSLRFVPSLPSIPIAPQSVWRENEVNRRPPPPGLSLRVYFHLPCSYYASLIVVNLCFLILSSRTGTVKILLKCLLIKKCNTCVTGMTAVRLRLG
jgi:hypothetical protein